MPDATHSSTPSPPEHARPARLRFLASFALPAALILLCLLPQALQSTRSPADWRFDLRDPVISQAPTNLKAYLPADPTHVLSDFAASLLVSHTSDDSPISALLCLFIHLFCCFQLFRFLLQLKVHWHAATLSALLFLFAPTTTFALSSLTNCTIAASTAIFLCVLRRSLSPTPEQPPPKSLYVRLLFLFTLTLLGLATDPSSVGILFTLPFLIFAARRHINQTLPISTITPASFRFNRLALPLISIFLALALHASITATLAPSPLSSSSDPSSAFPESSHFTSLLSILRTSWSVGCQTLKQLPGDGLPLLVTLSLLALAFIASSSSHLPHSASQPQPRARPLLLLASLLLPLSLLASGSLYPNSSSIATLFYPLTLSPILLFCILLDTTLSSCRCSPSAPTSFITSILRLLLVAATASLLLAASICNLGRNTLLKTSIQTDRRIIGDLVRAIPDPPADAVFILLRDHRRSLDPADDPLDQLQPTLFSTAQSAQTALARAYTRRDITFINNQHCIPSAITAVSDNRPRISLRFDPLDTAPPIPTSQIIPFNLSPRSKVVFIDRIILQTLSGTSVSLSSFFPSISRPAHSTDQPASTVHINIADTGEPAQPITPWLTTQGDPVTYTTTHLWHIRLPATRLHVGSTPTTFTSTINLSNLADKLALQVSLDPHQLKTLSPKAGVRITIRDQLTNRELTRLDLLASKFIRDPYWHPITLPLAHDSPTHLRIEISRLDSPPQAEPPIHLFLSPGLVVSPLTPSVDNAH